MGAERSASTRQLFPTPPSPTEESHTLHECEGLLPPVLSLHHILFNPVSEYATSSPNPLGIVEELNLIQIQI